MCVCVCERERERERESERERERVPEKKTTELHSAGLSTRESGG